MKIAQQPQPPISSNSQKPNQPQAPQPPEGNFSDKFVAATEHASAGLSNTLYPLAFCVIGSRIGGNIGGALLGNGGALVGSLGMSMVGYRFGAHTARQSQQMISDLSGDSSKGKAVLSTVYAAALGGLMLGAVNGFNGSSLALGAGVTLAGVGGYGVWKATR